MCRTSILSGSDFQQHETRKEGYNKAQKGANEGRGRFKGNGNEDKESTESKLDVEIFISKINCIYNAKL